MSYDYEDGLPLNIADDWDDDEDYEELNTDISDDWDRCYECGGYGDDYFVNAEGELECACPTCPWNPNRDTGLEDEDTYWED
jgi:hypothetical protein